MQIAIIVAMDQDRVIGRANRLPWRLAADMQRMKQISMGKPIIMGRKTHESIGRVLPGRLNIIVTRQNNYQVDGATVVHSLAEALKMAEQSGLSSNGDPAAEVIIFGGAELYRESLPLAQKIYLTEVHAKVAGDTYFPELNRNEWREISRENHTADANHEYDYSFVVMEKYLI